MQHKYGTWYENYICFLVTLRTGQNSSYICVSNLNSKSCDTEDRFFPVKNSNNNQTELIYMYYVCAGLRERILAKEVQFCSTNLQYFTVSSDNCTAKQEIHFFCPVFVPPTHIIIPSINIPLVSLVTLVTLVLVVWRRNYFPLKVKNIRALVLQIVCFSIAVISIQLQPYLPCFLFTLVLPTMLPLSLSFMLSRVCIIFLTTYNLVAQLLVQFQAANDKGTF